MKKQEESVELPGINVVVAVPCMTQLESWFAYDLAQLMAFTSAHFLGQGQIANLGLIMTAGTYVHSARQNLTTEALAGGADYILFLDSDMRFPKDALIRLLGHQEAMVGCNYIKRSFPPRFVGIKSTGSLEEGGSGLLMLTMEDSTGLEDCDALGFGVMLVHKSVFEALPDPREHGPWWFFRHVGEGKQEGEDVYFCRLVREAGFTIACDHDLSKYVKHLGQEQYGLEHAWAWAQQKRAETDGDSNELPDAGDGDSPDSEPCRLVD